MYNVGVTQLSNLDPGVDGIQNSGKSCNGAEKRNNPIVNNQITTASTTRSMSDSSSIQQRSVDAKTISKINNSTTTVLNKVINWFRGIFNSDAHKDFGKFENSLAKLQKGLEENNVDQRRALKELGVIFIDFFGTYDIDKMIEQAIDLGADTDICDAIKMSIGEYTNALIGSLNNLDKVSQSLKENGLINKYSGAADFKQFQKSTYYKEVVSPLFNLFNLSHTDILENGFPPNLDKTLTPEAKNLLFQSAICCVDRSYMYSGKDELVAKMQTGEIAGEELPVVYEVGSYLTDICTNRAINDFAFLKEDLCSQVFNEFTNFIADGNIEGKNVALACVEYINTIKFLKQQIPQIDLDSIISENRSKILDRINSIGEMPDKGGKVLTNHSSNMMEDKNDVQRRLLSAFNEIIDSKS